MHPPWHTSSPRPPANPLIDDVSTRRGVVCILSFRERPRASQAGGGRVNHCSAWLLGGAGGGSPEGMGRE